MLKNCYRSIFDEVKVISAVVDFPSVGSNQSRFVDIIVPDGVELGTLVEMVADSDASSMDDLIWTAYIVNTNVLRITMFNPTGGPADPIPTTFVFILSKINREMIPVVIEDINF